MRTGTARATKTANILSAHDKKRFEAQAWEALGAKLQRRGNELVRKPSKEQINLTTAHAQGKVTEASMQEVLTKMRNQKPSLAPKEQANNLLNLSSPRGNPVVQEDVTKFYFPPYNAGSTNQWHYGDPDQWVQLEQQQQGFVNLAEYCISHSSGGWGWAGVGTWYQPQVQNATLVYFRPLIRWGYDWMVQAAELSADTHGEVGVQVFSLGQDGLRDEGKSSLDIFSAHTNGIDVDPLRGSNDGLSALELPVQRDPARWYFCEAYVFANTDSSGTAGIFAGSQSSCDFHATVPWIVIEDIGMQ